MGISLFQSIESPPMPPRTDKEYGDTSFTSVPPELLDAARDLARKRKVYPRDVFTLAILDLITRLNAGKTTKWPQARPGKAGRPYHTRLEVEVLEKIRDASERHEVKTNIFFMAALRDYLNRNGYQFEI